jgi:hypothetical protein
MADSGWRDADLRSEEGLTFGVAALLALMEERRIQRSTLTANELLSGVD